MSQPDPSGPAIRLAHIEKGCFGSPFLWAKPGAFRYQRLFAPAA